MEEVTEHRVLLSVFRIPVRWSDMDANAHVNNATYFIYFEQARIQWLDSVSMQNTAEGQGPVVVHTTECCINNGLFEAQRKRAVFEKRAQ